MSAEQWYTGRRPSHRPKPNPIAFLSELNAPEWMSDGLCAQTDPEAWFPEKGGSVREAKAVCSSCDVREQCLAYALEHQERFGIWGGLSERERRQLKKNPRAEPRPCAREGCTETIPVTAHASKRYHDADCRRAGREDLLIAGLDHQPFITAYVDEGLPIGRIAAQHGLQISLVTRILDQHGIDHSRNVSQARAHARRRVQEAS